MGNLRKFKRKQKLNLQSLRSSPGQSMSDVLIRFAAPMLVGLDRQTVSDEELDRIYQLAALNWNYALITKYMPGKQMELEDDLIQATGVERPMLQRMLTPYVADYLVRFKADPRLITKVWIDRPGEADAQLMVQSEQIRVR